MVLVLREADVRELLTMPAAIAALETAFGQWAAGQAQNRPRARIVLPEEGGVLHMLAAAAPHLGPGVLGYKTYTAFRQGVRFVVMLYATADGALLAQMEADWLGQMRTGAASGLATRHMAREDATTVGLVGTGGQAHTQLMAVCAVRAIKTVRVFGRDEARRDAFCREMEPMVGVEVRPAPSAEESVREADIVITATTAREPVVLGEWLRPGTHVNAMGSNWATRREVDAVAVERSAIVAVDDLEQARLEAGDLVMAASEGRFDFARAVPLAEVVAGRYPGRSGASDLTLFKSLGIGLEDIAVAQHIYELARQRGVGEDLRFLP